MSINLVDLVMKQVGGNLPGVLGSLLGESADKTKGALDGAVPAILGGLMGVASKGGAAADQLAAAVGGQDDSMLDNLAGMLGGGEHRAIADQGGSLLKSLLGDGVAGSLVGAVSKFSGLGSGSSKSLLGTLVPIVMSVLGRQQKNQGLDASGLMGMLNDQKDHISKAMPSGLATALGGTGFLDALAGSAGDAAASLGDAVRETAGTVGDAVGSAAGAAGEAASSVATTAGDGADAVADAAARAARTIARAAANAAPEADLAASDVAAKGVPWLRWALPLVILLLLIWLGYSFLGGSGDDEAVSDVTEAPGSAVEATTEVVADAVNEAGDAVRSVTEATTEVVTEVAVTDIDTGPADKAAGAASTSGNVAMAMVGDVDVGMALISVFEGMADALGGVIDAASAEAAVPALEKVSASLDSLTGLADQLPEGAAGGVSEMVGSAVSGIDGLMRKLNAKPGVGDAIDPVVTEIKEKLAAFTPT